MFRTRFVTAASLFDGHDASINIMRRLLQNGGAEVIHLGHNRSVQEIVDAAVQEDAQAIAISSYQGGHVEFFKYMIDLLKEKGCPHIKVFGGGGGTIAPHEAKELEAYGVVKIYSPEDGMKLGLEGIIDHMLKTAAVPALRNIDWGSLKQFGPENVKGNAKPLAQALTVLELGRAGFTDEYSAKATVFDELQAASPALRTKPYVVGLTGTGGAGKSSLTDEIALRFLEANPEGKIAILAVDPTRRKTGGALLGDRLRVNVLKGPRTFMRSLATREANASISPATKDCLELLKKAGFDWILVETGGIGQADTSLVGLCDVNVYVMTSEFGAPTQLEKINMLDYADIVVINKIDKSGSLDALTEVRKQIRRNHREWLSEKPERFPVIGTMASHFADKGVDLVFGHLTRIKEETTKRQLLSAEQVLGDPGRFSLVPKQRTNYLADVASTVREYKQRVKEQTEIVAEVEALDRIEKAATLSDAAKKELHALKEKRATEIIPEMKARLDELERLSEQYKLPEFSYQIRNQTFSVPMRVESLSRNEIRKVVPPTFQTRAERFRFAQLENLPGHYPFTAGVFPFKREGEDPKRQFAGEGPPARTNARFHLLCKGEKAKRLSTAFDSVTLYGENPDERPDIYGKVGESGVSICTLEDAKRLYQGFDLCDPNTSVSMTINGPAPMLLAFFFNTAIDQQVEKFVKENGKPPTEAEHDSIRRQTLETVRGTVQADILKEDQAQNTCIFSTEFALRMMGDVQQFFIDNKVKNYYSVSISGYHIAEAGANPISQLAFTLANGFTFVEYYLARGMKLDDFAPNFSFFFSNGLDPEYTVIGRVARRIWALAMKQRYGGAERSQKLKYHIQTSGRSLHAQEISFNDIRTTLQALIAHFDNCNSLHTNAYDEAVTTPTAESVRRAMAIQLIISKEFGWAKNENPLQGSFFIDELTELVEEAVLAEFERLSARGGVLGAMETHYQRSRIQEESLYYETLKHSGKMPIIGVNSYLNPVPGSEEVSKTELVRASYEEKTGQISALREFEKKHAKEAAVALQKLKEVARSGGNLFQELMHAARVCSLGQMSKALYEVGGQYRRGM